MLHLADRELQETAAHLAEGPGVARREKAVAGVASSPTLRFRVACTAAWASGVITPTTGTDSSSWSCGSAADVAALQATRISFTSCASRKPPISAAKRRISASGRGPYGRRA